MVGMGGCIPYLQDRLKGGLSYIDCRTTMTRGMIYLRVASPQAGICIFPPRCGDCKSFSFNALDMSLEHQMPRGIATRNRYNGDCGRAGLGRCRNGSVCPAATIAMTCFPFPP